MDQIVTTVKGSPHNFCLWSDSTSDSYLVEWGTKSEEYDRFNCHPEDDADEAKCKARGCEWKVRDEILNESTIGGAPWCFYPKDYGYNVERITNTSTSMTVEIVRNRMYGTSGRPKSPDIDKLRVEIVYHSSDMFRFKIWDPSTPRYEVPVPLTVPSAPEPDEDKRLYKVTVTDKPFGIQVIRKSTGTKMGDFFFDSTEIKRMVSTQISLLSTRLSSEFVYGFGETEHTTYRHDLNYHTWGMFSKDQPPGVNVTFQPTPALTYRTLGGILDFYMILGPTPEMVVQEYTALIGRPVLPAYWSLGFQLCRYGYKDDTEIKNLYEDMKAAGIPYVSSWMKIPSDTKISIKFISLFNFCQMLVNLAPL
uniref:P-type domain-containing protein n=1 Tax=Salarias fasciatus TaxID=181472 RepID=A0A672GPS6_SALFA